MNKYEEWIDKKGGEIISPGDRWGIRRKAWAGIYPVISRPWAGNLIRDLPDGDGGSLI